MKHRLHFVFFPALLLCMFFAGGASAQFVLPNVNTSATENFDALPPGLSPTGTGGYLYDNTSSAWGTESVDPPTIPGNAGGNFRYENAQAPGEFAFGGKPFGAGDTAFFAVRFQVGAGQPTITCLEVEYFGEQWSLSENAANPKDLLFSYKTGAGLTSLKSGGWTDVLPLNFAAPQSASASGTAQIAGLDGNGAAARVQVSGLITGLSLAPGDEIVLRWAFPDTPGAEPHLSVDDLIVTPQSAHIDQPGVQNVACDEFTIGWAGATAQQAELEVSTDPTFATLEPGFPQTISNPAPPNNSFVVNNVAQGQKYYYRLRGVSGNCVSAWSRLDSADLQTGADPPANLSDDNITCTGFDAEWDAVPGAIEYEVEFFEDFPAFVILADFRTTTNTTTTYSGLNPDSFYGYRVRARTACGFSDWVYNITRTLDSGTALAAPTGVVGSATCDELSLNFSAVNGALNYEIELHSNAGFTNLLDARNSTTPSATFTALNADTQYWYRIRAVGGCGNSAWTTGTATTLLQPVAPTPLTAPNIGCDQLALQWPATNGTEYEVELHDDPSYNNLVEADTTPGTQTAFSNLNAGATYYARVRAVNSCGNSVWTETTIELLGAPETPENLTLANITCNSFDMTWGFVQGAPNYEVEVSTTADFAAPLFSSQPSNTIENLTGLTGGLEYWVRVRAVNPCGFSGWAKDSLLLDGGVQSPSNLLAINISCNQFEADWDAPGLNNFDLELHGNSAFTDLIRAENTSFSNFVFNNLDDDTDYWFRVRTVGACGESDWITASVKTEPGPEAPDNLVLTRVSCTHFELDWDDVPGATGYRIEIHDDPGFTSLAAFTSVGSSGGGFSQLPYGTTYYYRVRSNDDCGFSDWTTGSVTLDSGSPAPTNLVVQNVECRTFEALWDERPGADNYEVELFDDPGYTNLVFTFTPTTGFNFFNNLTVAAEYWFRVRVVDSCGPSDWTDGYVKMKDFPVAPTGVVVSDVACTSFALDWDDMVDASKYDVEFHDNPNFTNLVSSNDPAFSEVGFSGLPPDGAQYWYRVRSINDCGASDWTTGTFNLLNQLDAPLDLQTDLTSCEFADVSWAEVQFTVRYEVELYGGPTQNTLLFDDDRQDNSIRLENLAPETTYRLRVRAVVECAESDWTEITFETPAVPVLNFTSPASICRGDDAELSVSGAAAYVWMPGGLQGAQVVVTPAATATYTVSATAANQCETSQTVTVEVDEPTDGGVLPDETYICEADGQATLNLTGAVGEVLFWEKSENDFGSVLNTLSGAGASLNVGNLTGQRQYRARVKNGVCPAEYSSVARVIPENNDLEVVADAPARVCAEDNAGIIRLLNRDGGQISGWESSTDGWNTIETINETGDVLNWSGLTETTAFRPVVISPNCPDKRPDGAVITVDPKPDPGVLLEDQLLCYDETPQPLQLTGYSGDILRWESSTSNFASANTISTTEETLSITGGPQNIQYRAVVGSGVCPEAFSNAVRLTVYPGDPIQVEADVEKSECFGENKGKIVLRVSGGNSPYFYQWTKNGALFPDSDRAIDNAGAGFYVARVTDRFGCFVERGFLLEEPDALLIQNVRIKPVSCFGENDGAVGLDVTGGNPPYSYFWTTGDRTEDIEGVGAGPKILIATDANNCRVIDVFNVPEPPPLRAEISLADEPGCAESADGSLMAGITGGVSPYDIQWSNGQNNQLAGNLTAGTHTLIATDANGCQTRASFLLTSPPQLFITTTRAKPPRCFGDENGFIQLSVSGGRQPYNYMWNDGVPVSDRIALSGGAYTLTVTDANGCEASQTWELEEPQELTAQFVGQAHLDCFGEANGRLSARAKGGVQPYRYRWNDGSAARDREVLAAGAYSLTVTDANGCRAMLNEEIREPEELLSVRANQIIPPGCAGASDGAISTEVSGGTAPYIYKWNTGAATENLAGLPAGFYSMTATDANGCSTVLPVILEAPQKVNVHLAEIKRPSCAGKTDGTISATVTGGKSPYVFRWSDGSANSILRNAEAGVYGLTVTDANGCSAERNNIQLDALVPLTINLSKERGPSCAGYDDGALSVKVAGGAPGYAIQWLKGANAIAVGASAYELEAGNYRVRATDANGCETEATFSLEAPEQLKLEIERSAPTCADKNDGSASVAAIGGTPPYVYQWSTGAKTQAVSGLGNGAYVVRVTDANGCPASAGFPIFGPPQLEVHIEANAGEACGEMAELTSEVSGVTPPYVYQWSNGAGSSSIAEAPDGAYALTVTDANGCAAVSEEIVVENPKSDLRAQLNYLKRVDCYGQSTGAVALDARGGTPPYAFQWSAGKTTEDLRNVPAGVYTLTLTDARGCESVTTYEVRQPDAPLAATLRTTDETCAELNDGLIQLEVTGGTQPYEYFWTHGPRAQDVINLDRGAYAVVVRDANGCAIVRTARVGGPAPLSAQAVSITPTTCAEQPNGSVEAAAFGGTPPYTYQWTSQTGPLATGLAAGVHQVLVKDAAGCAATFGFDVPDERLSAELIAIPPSCDDCADGALIVVPSGGVGPYEYSFDGGGNWSGLTMKNELKAGSYTVLVRDESTGCVVPISAELAAPECTAPEILSAEAAFGEITVEWNAVSGASGYVISYKDDRFNSSWQSVSAPVNPQRFKLQNLKPGGRYLVRMRARCGENWSPWSAPFSAKAAALRGESKTGASGLAFRLYPNPARDEVVLTGEFADVKQIAIFDARGAMSKTMKLGADTVERSEMEIDLRGLSSGLYFVEIRQKEVARTFKLVVE